MNILKFIFQVLDIAVQGIGRTGIIIGPYLGMLIFCLLGLMFFTGIYGLVIMLALAFPVLFVLGLFF